MGGAPPVEEACLAERGGGAGAGPDGRSRPTWDVASFSAGQDCGTRVAACVARLAALELIADSRWWNRRRHRLMARALFACAEELEESATAADGRRAGEEEEPAPALRSAATHGEAAPRPLPAPA